MEFFDHVASYIVPHLEASVVYMFLGLFWFVIGFIILMWPVALLLAGIQAFIVEPAEKRAVESAQELAELPSDFPT